MIPRVSIIILNWNGWEDTIECLESVYNIKYPAYDVIVVDNGSEDDSVSKIKSYCKGEAIPSSSFFEARNKNKPLKIFEYNPEIDNQEIETDNIIPTDDSLNNNGLILLETGENKGFAAGNNVGMKFAYEHLTPDYFLLLNNDTVVDSLFLNELVEVANSDDKIGFVGPKTYYYDNKNVLQVAGGAKIDLYRAEPINVDLGEIDRGQYDENFELGYVNGSCMLCKTEMAKKIGLMDESHFMYWEETDWCYRARNNGYKSVYAFKSMIWHKVGKSSQTSLKVFYHNRNRVYFMRKNVNGFKMTIYLIYLFLIYFWFMSAVYLIYRKDRELFRAFYQGTKDGFKVKPKIVKI